MATSSLRILAQTRYREGNSAMPRYFALFAFGIRQVVRARICLGHCRVSSMRLRRMATTSRPSSESRP
eukprot:16428716-Heterocapsa_arctica.AAC.1